MEPDRRPSHKATLSALGSWVSFLCIFCAPSEAQAVIYVHQTPLTFAWTASTGSVDHYNVYVSVDGGAFRQVSEVRQSSYRLDALDGRRYVVEVDAEDGHGNRSPMSDPSDGVVVFLGGSASDTDGDGMPDAWETYQGFNPYDPSDALLDSDGDGLVNLEECRAGTSPSKADTDDDGVSDSLEVARGQNPLDAWDNRPTARAGPDQDVDPTVVTLNGTESSDPNGDPLSFAWSQSSGPSVPLNGPATPKPTFPAKKQGEYRFRLVVKDGRVESLPDETVVRVRNVAPTADAGSDQVVDAGTAVTLDGSASRDPNEDPLRFSWRQVEGDLVQIQGADRAKASFVTWNSGVFRFELVVCDAELCSAPDPVQVVVHGTNHVPTAVAGPDLTANVFETVVLDGSASSDPDGDALEFLWTQVEGPEQVALEGSAEAKARFEPWRAGLYRFELVVTDGENVSPPDSVTVMVLDANRRPVALADAPATARVGDWVPLDGSGSYDPDRDPLTWQWTQIRGTRVTLAGADSPVAGFFALQEGTVEFELVVRDLQVASSPARVSILIEGVNRVPTANAGEDRTGVPGEQVCLDGTGSFDPDPGDTLAYSWVQISGPRLTLEGARTAFPCFTASLAGLYSFGLTVSDGRASSLQDTVDVRIQSSSGQDPPPGEPDQTHAPHPARASSSSGGGCALAANARDGSGPGAGEWGQIAVLFLPALVWLACLKRKVRGSSHASRGLLKSCGSGRRPWIRTRPRRLHL